MSFSTSEIAFVKSITIVGIIELFIFIICLKLVPDKYFLESMLGFTIINIWTVYKMVLKPVTEAADLENESN